MSYQKRGRYYKGMRVNAFGLPVFQNEIKKDKRIRPKRASYFISFLSPFHKDTPKNLIVMYDISSIQRRERDWFRRQLVKFGFVMIQKSVWVGPSPLPKDFLDYLKEIKIRDSFKTFKLAKPYDSNKKIL
jgi:DNA-binding transcriptional regulator PaaX